jgi:hypothetical protein
MEAAESGRSRWAAPTKVDGLYDPALEKEACGVGFVVQIDGIRSNKVIIIKIDTLDGPSNKLTILLPRFSKMPGRWPPGWITEELVPVTTTLVTVLVS